MKLTTLIFTGTALSLAIVFGTTPAGAQIACDLNGVPTAPPLAVGAMRCGSIISQPVADSTSVGVDAMASFGAGSTAVGTDALAAALPTAGSITAFGSLDYIPTPTIGSTAIGSYSYAIGFGTLAVGDQAGVGTLTITTPSFLELTAATNGTAIGSHSLVTGANATAVGMSAQATAAAATAVGQNAAATAVGASALGVGATASGEGSVAVGQFSTASEFDSVAVGFGTTASGASSVAVGDVAQATAANSVALGAGSVADQANTVSVGAAGAERRIVNVAAGTAPTDAVNVSQLGVVTTNVNALQTQIIGVQTVNSTQETQISALQATDVDFNNRITSLETNALDFADDLDRVDDRAAAGTAAAVALSGAMFIPGKSFNLTGNVGAYRGAVAGALQVGALVSDSVAVNAGVAHGFNKHGKTAFRAGFSFGF